MMGLRQHTLLSLLGITGLAVHGADDSIDQISCDEAQILRTGDWVNKQCTIDEVVMLYSFTPSERWKALECQYGWEDAIRVWRACNSSKYDGYDFATSIADFLHVPLKSVGRPQCQSCQKTPETEIDCSYIGMQLCIDRDRLRAGSGMRSAQHGAGQR